MPTMQTLAMQVIFHIVVLIPIATRNQLPFAVDIMHDFLSVDFFQNPVSNGLL
jgi:hypothetical protein